MAQPATQIQTYLHDFDTIKQELRAVYDLKDETAPKRQ